MATRIAIPFFVTEALREYQRFAETANRFAEFGFPESCVPRSIVITEGFRGEVHANTIKMWMGYGFYLIANMSGYDHPDWGTQWEVDQFIVRWIDRPLNSRTIRMEARVPLGVMQRVSGGNLEEPPEVLRERLEPARPYTRSPEPDEPTDGELVETIGSDDLPWEPVPGNPLGQKKVRDGVAVRVRKVRT